MNKTGNVHIFVILRRVCETTAAVEKQEVSVSVAVVIRHAMRVQRVTLSSVACLALPHFSTLCHDYGEESN